ncbi:50S ribosomal protein 6, chloroplastic [Abrus precatorius]|uniref:50S ribosomal protein 6, chloroplastic n=1 Tax=Abrus precatorius TaxID=3816 RepID=A0A8B8LPR9_ABRPR|nr:50S ribosomal protein 6, chloroplastic [Abrus precatorius]
MWVSTSILGSRVVMAPQSSIPRISESGLTIVCSSRPKKKATSHHMKTRPRKTQPWDINRKPTVYSPLPPLPPDWTVVIPADDSSVAVTAPPSSPST